MFKNTGSNLRVGHFSTGWFVFSTSGTFLYSSDYKQEKVEERFVGGEPSLPPTGGSAQIIDVKPAVPPNIVANEETPAVPKSGPNGMIIRGMTFYKSEPDPMVADDGDPGENRK